VFIGTIGTRHASRFQGNRRTRGLYVRWCGRTARFIPRLLPDWPPPPRTRPAHRSRAAYSAPDGALIGLAMGATKMPRRRRWETASRHPPALNPFLHFAWVLAIFLTCAWAFLGRIASVLTRIASSLAGNTLFQVRHILVPVGTVPIGLGTFRS